MLPNCQLVLVGDMVGKDEILRALIAASSNFNSVCELQRAFWCTQRCVGVSVSDDMVRNFFHKDDGFCSVGELRGWPWLHCFQK